MDPSHLGATPGSGSGGSEGRSVDASSRRPRRMSTPSAGTLLMLEFNVVSGGGDGGSSGSSSSSVGLDLRLHQSHPARSLQPPPCLPRGLLDAEMGHLVFLGFPMGSQTTDDEVLVMDGVLIANGSVSTPRRTASFTDLGVVLAGSPGEGGCGHCGSNRQAIASKFCPDGKDEKTTKSKQKQFKGAQIMQQRASMR